jgi:hypothetical protein
MWHLILLYTKYKAVNNINYIHRWHSGLGSVSIQSRWQLLEDTAAQGLHPSGGNKYAGSHGQIKLNPPTLELNLSTTSV